MPGIYGIVSPNWNEIPATLQAMRQKLRSGFEKANEGWIDDVAGVGFGRDSLGVYDLGVQPVFDDLRNLVLILDGVLYNKEELRRELIDQGYGANGASVASLALSLYENYGPDGFARLEGIFTLILWDRIRRRVTLANDRFGLRPLYYSQQGNRLAFASEVKALLDLPFVSRQVDDAAVADLFAFDHLFGDRTLFEDIRLLTPGSILSFQDGSLRTQSYWHSNFSLSKIHRHEPDCAEEMATLLEESLRRRLKIWPDIGLSLSGGLDSRTLLAVATQRLSVKLPTYTYGLANSNDVGRAKTIAKRVKTQHHESILENNYLSTNAERMVDRTEGLLNCLQSHGFNLLEMVPPGQVILLGLGSESFFYSFRSYKKFSFTKGEDPVYTFFKLINRVFPQAQWSELFSETFYPRIEGRAFQSLTQAAKPFLGCPPDDLIEAVILEATLRGWLQGIYMINHRFEYCLPYFDYGLVDFALALPFDLRSGRKLLKMTLCHVSPELAKLPGGPLAIEDPFRKVWNRGIRKVRQLFNYLSHGEINPQLAKPSGTFSDLHSLLRGPNRKWVERILLDDRTLGRHYFKPQAIRTLVGEHMDGKRNLGMQLGTLLTFELWHRQFVD